MLAPTVKTQPSIVKWMESKSQADILGNMKIQRFVGRLPQRAENELSHFLPHTRTLQDGSHEWVYGENIYQLNEYRGSTCLNVRKLEVLNGWMAWGRS